MAAGAVTVLDLALEKLGAGEFALDTDTFAVALCTADQALAADFTGGSGEALYSDLTAEVDESGSGYTTGGEDLGSVTWSETSAGVISFTADPTVWTAVTLTAKYAVIYLTTTGSSGDILAIVDLEESEPTGRTSTGGDFTINWASALFTLSRAA